MSRAAGHSTAAATFDVIVVGGGPAGAATAIALAGRGLRAALVERDVAPRPRVGETLPPSARTPLEALGVWPRFAEAGHEPAVGNRSTWGSDRVEEAHFIRSAYGCGWHLDRPGFEAMLLAVAEERGVTLVRGAQLEAARHDGSIWRMRAARTLEARFAVDATGRNALLSRICGAKRISIDRLVGVTVFLGPRGGGGDPEGKFTFIEAAEQGWWYSAPLPGGRLIAACMTDGDLAARMAGSLDGWLAAARRTWATQRRLDAYALPGGTAPRLWSANTARLSSVVGPGWLAVGDAAVSFDPLSSQGIATALESGIEAAEAIDAHLAGDAAATSRYAAAVSARYRLYLVERARYYGAEGRWPRSPFWRRRQGHRTLTRAAKVHEHATIS
jgi:flavin-dependent dehydrogenase